MQTELKFMEVLKRVEYNTTLTAKTMLTIKDASIFTGLSVKYLYRLTSAKKIPHYKPTGKGIYFDKNELQAWLKRNKVETAEGTTSTALLNDYINS